MIKPYVWISWFLVAVKNFPRYEIKRTNNSTLVLFQKTGHTLDVSNPYGLSETYRKKVREGTLIPTRKHSSQSKV